MQESIKTAPKLADYATNHYSQFGEDGIIEKIFSLIGTTSKICIEFGAWDGFHLSNTANLWTKGWQGVLIEGNRSRYKELVKNVREYNCICINAFVTQNGTTQLESLLVDNGVKDSIDLLSIDIDGDDYYILNSLQKLRPRVVIIEYNPTIPAHHDIYAPCGSNFGASVAALTRLAEEKGYKLVAITRTNCFFVLEKEALNLNEFISSIDELKIDDSLVYLMTSYSGEFVASQPGQYGCTVPYKYDLIGPHHKICHLFSPLRFFSDGMQKINNFRKKYLHG